MNMNYQSVEEFYGIGKIFKKATKSVSSGATDLGKSTGITDDLIKPSDTFFNKDVPTGWNQDLPAGWSKEIQKPTDTFFNKDLDPSKNGLTKGWNKVIGNPFKNNFTDPAGKFLTKDLPKWFNNDFLDFFKSSWKWIVFVAAIILVIIIIKFIT